MSEYYTGEWCRGENGKAAPVSFHSTIHSSFNLISVSFNAMLNFKFFIWETSKFQSRESKQVCWCQSRMSLSELLHPLEKYVTSLRSWWFKNGIRMSMMKIDVIQKSNQNVSFEDRGRLTVKIELCFWRSMWFKS